MSDLKKNPHVAAVKVSGGHEKPKNSPAAKGAERKLTAPELPGSYKFILADDKGEDSDCVAIQVTFFRKNIQETMFMVDSPDEGRVLKSIAEYEMYKDAKKAKNREAKRNEAAAGWLKKLSIRCMLFPKNLDGGAVNAQALMSITPIPKVVLGMMSLSQIEFSAKFSSPEKVLDFWIAVQGEHGNEIESYAKLLGCDWLDTINIMSKSRDEKIQKKSEKDAKRFESLSNGGKPATGSSIPMPPIPKKKPEELERMDVYQPDGSLFPVVQETIDYFNGRKVNKKMEYSLIGEYTELIGDTQTKELFVQIKGWIVKNPTRNLDVKEMERFYDDAFKSASL